MSQRNKGIGVFDSGIGGLTVLKELELALPNEDLIYLGDTARVPYGNKSPETVTRYSIENSKFLIEAGVKMIVVACNTASALSLDSLQKQFKVPVIGVLQPGVTAALSKTKSNQIGIIGTEATLSSGAYTKALQTANPAVRVWGVACPLFVPLVEEGWHQEEVTSLVAQKYLFTFSKTPIDTLILGCTHYPVLKNIIQKTVGNQVHLVDSAEETASSVKQLLNEKNLEREDVTSRQVTLFVTDSPHRFKEVGKNFLRRPLDGVGLVGV